VCRTATKWTLENTLAFTELYQKMSVLWDPNHPKSYNKLHKYGVWKDIEKAMGRVPEEYIYKDDSLLSSCRRARERERTNMEEL